MDTLEKLDVWKYACRLSADLYQELNSCKNFSYRDQVTRAGLSIPSNIAEGYERQSAKACIQFLKIAKGSCGELWTQLLVGRSAGLINSDKGKKLESDAQKISKMLYGLIRHYENNTGSPGSQ